MQTITLSIPNTLSEKYSNTVLQSLMLQNFVIAEFQRGNISIRDSASILEISYNEFIDLLGNYHLSFINSDLWELKSNSELFLSFVNKRTC